jgi:hypothetical protein
MGVVGMGLLDWPMALVPPPRAPTDTAVAPIYFKNFLLETSFDILPTSFLSDGSSHQYHDVNNLCASPPFWLGISSIENVIFLSKRSS